MNGMVYAINRSQLRTFVDRLPHTDEEKARLVEAGGMSMPMLAGIYRSELLCLVGFIPITLFSDAAYIWVHVTEAGEAHKLIFARHAYDVITKAHAIYPRLVGVCFNDRSRYWLGKLGAKFTTDTNFEIRRA